MSKIFNFSRAIDKNLRQDKSAQDLEQQAADFDLAGTGGYPAFVKYVVFTLLAALNWHLFYTHIPGMWGIAVASIAVLFEGFAVHCWNKQNKSADRHKQALQGFAIGFTVVSFVHGIAALYDIADAGPSISPIIYFYSKYVAFPLLFSLMILAVCALYYTHWSTEISEERAKAQKEIQKGKARLLNDTAVLRDQAALEKERLTHFREMILIEEQYVDAVSDFATVKARGEAALQAITDPDVKRQLLQALGRIAPEDSKQKRIASLSPATARTDNDPKAQSL